MEMIINAKKIGETTAKVEDIVKAKFQAGEAWVISTYHGAVGELHEATDAHKAAHEPTE